MTVEVKCPSCQQSYQVGQEQLGRSARCKQCGQQFALGSTTGNGQAKKAQETGRAGASATRSQLPQKLGRFEIRAKLGAGAFGAVYRAYDPLLDREVALKVPHPGALESEKDKARYLREPKAAAQLRHPHIVPIFDAGLDGEHFFIASAFIKGQTLEHALQQERPDFRRAATLVMKLAGALDYAHSQGIVHRDVKPANIMLDEKGEPHLMDFGLARIRAAEDKLTHDGTVLGTPAYMPPEQASGQLDKVGPASDQYSLGVVLYELLCGERPFSGPPALVVSLVVNSEPPSPRTHNPKIPKDLETICLKAMSKEASGRYSDCRTLGEDLRRWHISEPILARRTSVSERLVRWCRREPAVAGLTATTLAVFLVGFIISASQWHRAHRERNTAVQMTVQLAERQKELTESRNDALKQKAEAQVAARDALLGRAAALRSARIAGYRQQVKECLRQACALSAGTVEPQRLKNEVLAYLGDFAGLEPVAHPEGALIDRTPPARVAPPKSGSLSKYRLIIPGSQGQLAAVSNHAELDLVDSQGGTEQHVSATLGFIHSAAFTPNGERLVVGCEEGLIVFDVPALSVHAFHRSDVIKHVAVHPSGQLVAAVTRNSRVEIWSVASNRLLAEFTLADDKAMRFEFTASGEALLAIPPISVIRAPATGANDNTSQASIGPAWYITRTPERRLLFGHEAAVTSVAFSPDGAWLVSGSKDKTVRLWEAESGREQSVRFGHAGQVEEVVFSSDSTWIASGDWVGAVKVWRTEGDDKPLHAPEDVATLSQIWRLRFSPDGDYLAAATFRGAAQWPLTVTAGDMVIGAPRLMKTPPLYDLAMHPSGKFQVYIDNYLQLRFLDVTADDFKIAPGIRAKLMLPSLWFSPKGEVLHFLANSGQIATLDWATRQLQKTRTVRFEHGAFAIAPNGSWAAVQKRSNQLAIYDLVHDRIEYELPPERSDIWTMDWSPDGSRVACGLADSTIVIWDLEAVRRELEEFDIRVASTISAKSAKPAN